ncbi:DUF4362 domain-containing protein [Cohnella terricola]|uniref:DUF4362 domain-containing protein n=1 Tax=Cohnella terricola TaxID=1289167 RepID=A0A559J8P8_9BACL|nr:DUF4362 domain-containing protein [Cohnella terricola]TVX96265.1 DUF4362 domain-containing protein [Cohnella terricola]
MVFRLLTLALVFISLISACSSKPYNYDTAINNGNIVNLHGNIKNGERLEVFYQNYKSKTKDKIRITQFTIEGDPIIYDFDFDGIDIKLRYDNSKDKHGTSNIRSTACKELIKTATKAGNDYTLKGCYGKDIDLGNDFRFEVST